MTGTHTEVGGHLREGAELLLESDVHRAHEDAVAQGDVGNGERLEQVRIAVVHATSGAAHSPEDRGVHRTVRWR